MKTPVFYTAAPPCIAPPALKNTLKELWAFTRRPRLLKREQNVLEVKLPLIFQLAFILLLLQVGLFIAVALLCTILGVQLLNASIASYIFAQSSFVPVFTTIVLLAPVTEELIFRLPLIYSRTFILIALLTFLLSLGPVIAFALNISFVPYTMGAIMLLGLVSWLLTHRKHKLRVHLLWKRHFGLVFYAFTATFALLHFNSPQSYTLPQALFVLLLLHKLVGGVFMGYTRLRLGMGWSVALHMFNNLVVLLVLLGYWAGV